MNPRKTRSVRDAKVPVKSSAVVRAKAQSRSAARGKTRAINERISAMTALLERAKIAKGRLVAQEAKLKKANADLALEIAERRRAEDLFRLVVESAPNGMLMIDRKSTIVLVNSQMEKMFGYTRQELLKKPVDTLLPERYRGQHPHYREEFLSDPRARTMGAGRELYALRKDGSEFPVEIGLNPVHTPEGTHILASVIDITARKAAEEHLKENEERFRSMIENVKDYAIFMLDPEGRIVTWNKGAEAATGYSAEEIIGKAISLFFPITDQRGLLYEQILQTALTEGRHETTMAWQLRKDGTKFCSHITTTAVRKPDGRLLGFSVVTCDLTEQQKNNSELKRAKEAAEEANGVKSDFIANVSHEIRTPMTGIIGMTGLLADTELSSKQAEYCQIIRQSSEALLTVINEVLDFSKVESGKLELEIIDFDLRVAVEEVLDLFANQAEDRGIELVSLVGCDVTEKVQGDPGRVRQVLSNLVGNALKFTKAGEIAVRVRLLRQTAKTVSLRFEINDTGMGIAKDKLAKLFGSFTQVDASTTRRFGGTGLGLAICKRFVELMGGEIGVDSEPDKGSSFWFTLDLLKSPENAFEVPSDRAHLRGLHMLVVEANALNRSAFDQYLTSWGISGSSAPDGRSALKMLSAAQNQGVPYDLVILDFKLPDMDGLELARKIRENPKLGAAKLLLLTSMAKKGDARSAREAGIDGYFTKPIHFSQLEECLALLMGEASTTEDSGTLLTLRTLAELKSQTRLRILVADDNHINQKVVASLLENMGHRAEVVGNGKEAVEAYRSAPYDIVLMDLQMPEMDGFEASHQIHEIAQAKGLKTSIVAVTARARKQDREACLARGMDDYVSKPISPMELRAAIDRTMAGAAKGASSNNSSPNPVNPGHTVDLVEALASIEGNRDLLREIVQMFIEQYPRLLEQIHQALSSSDGKALAAAAHTLRSSAGQVGAHEALDGARRLEEIGERESLAKAPAVLAKLEEELVRVKSALLENGYAAAR